MSFLNCLKHLIFLLGFLLICILPIIKIYNDMIIDARDFIFLSPKDYPEIEIDLDNQFRIPHITSKNIQGTLFGLGYMHAKDRLWQMQVKRLVSYGKLSEAFGEDVLFMDKYFRTLGLLEVCEKNLEYIKETSPETYANLIAYSSGVNEFVRTERKYFLPMEFYLVGVGWTEWSALDCLMLIKFAFVNLIVDWQAELFRSKLAMHFPAHIVEEIFPGRTPYQYDTSSDTITDEELKLMGLYQHNSQEINRKVEFQQKGELKQRVKSGKIKKDNKRKMYSSLNEILTLGAGHQASNTWVVHGNYTESGKAILCGDPHLDNNAPSIWYIAELKYLDHGQQQFAIGATMTGIPYVVFGRSQYLAWSGAIAIGDNSDAFEEVLNPEGTKYFFNGEYHDLIISSEDIKIKGRKEPYKLTIKKTRHGPIVDYLLSEISVKELWLDRTYSFAWPGLKDTEDSLTSFYNLYKINSWKPKEIVSAFANLSFTSISINIATNDGHILGVITSSWLKKQKQSPVDDFFPKDGTDPSNEWLGLIDPMEKPFVIDPPKGFIFQANNKFAANGYKYQTASNYITTARATRINELLSNMIKSGKKITPKDMMLMQQDTIDVYARDMVVKMCSIVKGLTGRFNKQEQRELEWFVGRMKGWNGNHDIESVEATIFSFKLLIVQLILIDTWQYLFRSHLLMFFEDEQDAIAIQHIYQFEQFLMHQITKWSYDTKKIFEYKAEPTYDICPQIHYSQITEKSHLELVSKHCAYLLPITLLMTKEFLQEKLGNEISNWQWGKLHQNRYVHIPFSEVPILRDLYEKRRPGAGNINTINCGIPNFKAKVFDSYHGPNFRMISEMNGKLYQILDTGENENPFSENYFDQAGMFARGEYYEIGYGNFQTKKIRI